MRLRATRWNMFAAIVKRIAPEQYELAQGLGMIEQELMAREAKLGSIPVSAMSRQHVYEHQILCAYTALWTFGAYELVRVLDSRLNPVRSSITHGDAKKLKRDFERVRVPLAKNERAKKAAEALDGCVAHPLRMPNGECGWLLGSTSITRRELADSLLAFRPARSGLPQ